MPKTKETRTERDIETVRKEFGDKSDPTNPLIYRPGFTKQITIGTACDIGGAVVRKISRAEYERRHGKPDDVLDALFDAYVTLRAEGYYEIDLDKDPIYPCE